MNLSTNYLGFHLSNPLVASPSTLTRSVDMIRRLEDEGIAAVVLNSIFEEEISHELDEHLHFDEFGTYSYAEALSFTPALDYTPRRSDEQLAYVSQVKEAVDIPVIASLNGATVGGWIDHGRKLQEAGADALELNIYYLATDPKLNGRDVENRYFEVVEAVINSVNIPVAVKMSPYFSSLAHFAKRLDERGVAGLVLFNRFYQPNIDLENLEVLPDLVLSAPHEMRLPLRWIAILDPIVEASLAATTGVYTYHDVLKLLMVGADAIMLCAVLMQQGPKAVSIMLDGLRDWMQEHEYESVRQMQGSMNHSTCPDPAAFERANYMKALRSYI